LATAGYFIRCYGKRNYMHQMPHLRSNEANLGRRTAFIKWVRDQYQKCIDRHAEISRCCSQSIEFPLQGIKHLINVIHPQSLLQERHICIQPSNY